MGLILKPKKYTRNQIPGSDYVLLGSGNKAAVGYVSINILVENVSGRNVKLQAAFYNVSKLHIGQEEILKLGFSYLVVIMLAQYFQVPFF